MKGVRTRMSLMPGPALIAAALMGAPAGDAMADHSVRVGVRCQQEYQNSWQADAGSTWRRCNNFIDQIGKTDRVMFYFNLHGAKPTLEQTDDSCGQACGSADSVEFLYLATRGGANSATAYFAMWDQDSFALSSNMRLGNHVSGGVTSGGLMVLVTFSSNGLLLSDGNQNILNRWLETFTTGLVLVAGAHGNLYSGRPVSGADFASRMQVGEPIGQAWLESTWYADNRNTPSFMNTGYDANDCYNRSKMALEGFYATTVIRGYMVRYLCWASWN